MTPRITDSEEPEPVVADAVPTPRARALIDALRQLAQFLADHPDVPVADYPELTYHARADTDAENWAIVDAAARAMGTEPKSNPEGTHYEATVTFGPLAYSVLAITAQHMDDYVERGRLGAEAFDARRRKPSKGKRWKRH